MYGFPSPTAWQSSRHCYIAAVSSTRWLVRSEKGNKAARWWCHKTGLARHFLQVYDSIKPLSHYRQNTVADNDAATSWISKAVVYTKKRGNEDWAEVLQWTIGMLALVVRCAAQGSLLTTFRNCVSVLSPEVKMLVRCRVVGVLDNRKPCVIKEMDIRQKTKREGEAGTRLRWLIFTSRPIYRGADKSLARPGRNQANVSVRMARISFGVLPCRKKKKNLTPARVSMLLKSRASLTCFRACFLPGRAKDSSAPRYYPYESSKVEK